MVKKRKGNFLTRFHSISRKTFHKFFRITLVVIMYLLVTLVIDLFSRKLQIYPGIVAWYPPDGISLAFIISLGVFFTPVVALASLLSSVFVYDFQTPLPQLVIWALFLASGFGVIGLYLRRKTILDRKLSTIRTGLWMVVSSGFFALILSVISVSDLIKIGSLPGSLFFNGVFQWWVGEMNGILIFTPFLLLTVMPFIQKFINGEKISFRKINLHKPNLEVIGQIISTIFLIYLVFGVPSLVKYHLFFLIAFPLIWVALRNGFTVTSVAVAFSNIGIYAAILLFKFDLSLLGEVQFLLFGVYLCVLLIGVVVSHQKRSDEVLHKNEILNRALIENAPDGIILLGKDRLIKFGSPSVERILGYTNDQLIGMDPSKLTHPEDVQDLQDQLVGFRQTPEVVITAQYRIKHSDGSWRWLESTFTNELNNLDLEAIIVNFRDITDRKQTEEALLKSEKRFKSLIEHSQEQISLVGADGTLIYESPNKFRPLGYPPESLVGNNLYDLFHPDELESVNQLMQTVARTPGMVKKALFRTKHANGSWRWMEGYISNLIEEPEVQSLVINYFDVTDRIEKEQQIAVLAKIPAESPNPVMRMSREGVLLYANETSKAIIKLWNSDVGEVVPKYMIDIGTVAYARQENIPVEINCDDKIFSVTVTPIIEAGYINLYGRDITKRVRAEESLKVSNDELSMLFQLSHSLAEANNLGHIFDIVNRHAVESMHNTFARIALLENDCFIMKAGFPAREINDEFRLGDCIPVSALPFSQHLLNENEIKVIDAGEPEIDDEERNILFIKDTQYLCLVPLRISDSSTEAESLVGLLMLGETGKYGVQPFTPQKLRLVQTIGDSAAIAIRRMLLNEQTERRMGQLIALSEIDLAIISNSDMHERLDVVCRQVMKQLSVDAVDVWIYDLIEEQLVFAGGRGFKTTLFDKAEPVQLDEGMLGQAFLKRQTIHISNIALHNKNPRFAKALAMESFVGYYAVPLIANNEVKGVLELFHRSDLNGNSEWLKFLQILANQAAIAIDNSILFNDLKQSNAELIQAYDATIQGWSHALDLRDNETEGHTQRVTELTMKLAHMFGLPDEDLIHIRRGALLHDIGKMGVPDRILLKPGPLSEEEWVIMRQHTSFAFDLISPITFLKPALDIPMCHHEKWDGTGYPRGLKGEEIPFAARLFSVVDVWDALTSDRPYRKAWSEEKTLDYIKSLAGTQFDPQVVRVCLEPGFLTGKSSQYSGEKLMQWSKIFSVGDKEMDLQHQRLMGIINRLISVTGANQIHSETLSIILDEMSNYVHIHFKAEERLMAIQGFPQLEEHKLQHQGFETRVKEFRVSLEHEGKSTANEMLEFLTNWWNHHILEEDMSYKKFNDHKKFD